MRIKHGVLLSRKYRSPLLRGRSRLTRSQEVERRNALVNALANKPTVSLYQSRGSWPVSHTVAATASASRACEPSTSRTVEADHRAAALVGGHSRSVESGNWPGGYHLPSDACQMSGPVAYRSSRLPRLSHPRAYAGSRAFLRSRSGRPSFRDAISPDGTWHTGRRDYSARSFPRTR